MVSGSALLSMPFVRTVLLGVLCASAALAQSSAPLVRVHVLSRASLSNSTVEAVGTAGVVTVDGVEAGSLQPGATVRLEPNGRQVRVLVDGTSLAGSVVAVDAGEIRIRSGRIDRRYPHRLEIRMDGRALQVVNHAPLETYVASVVASELNFPEIEAAKAQAVLARTYALRRRGQTPTHDLVDDQRSQVYRGLETITATSLRAAQETEGQTLTYRGELADAYYFSSSGGHTADNESLWRGRPIPYLRGVPDPYDTVAPDHSWRTTASRTEVLRMLSSRFGGSVVGVQVERRSPKGRVLAVRLVGGRTETITGTQFRQAVNAAAGARTVRSTRYEVSQQGDQFVFTGGGFGHGVGMSQFGAVGQARAGRSYRQILAHYFIGTDVSAGAAPLLARSSPPATSQPAEPEEPASALRTRYRPPSGRRWPTPRRLVGTEAEAEEVPAPTPPVLPGERRTRPTRRTAW